MPLFEVDPERAVLVAQQQDGTNLATTAQRVVDGQIDSLLGEQIFPVSERRSEHEPYMLAIDAAGSPVVIEVVASLDEHVLTRAMRFAGAAGRLTRAQLANRYSGGPEAFERDLARFRADLPFGAVADPAPGSGARLVVICSAAREDVLDAVDFLRKPGARASVLRASVVTSEDGRRFVDVSPLVTEHLRAAAPVQRTIDEQAPEVVATVEAPRTAAPHVATPPASAPSADRLSAASAPRAVPASAADPVPERPLAEKPLSRSERRARAAAQDAAAAASARPAAVAPTAPAAPAAPSARQEPARTPSRRSQREQRATTPAAPMPSVPAPQDETAAPVRRTRAERSRPVETAPEPGYVPYEPRRDDDLDSLAPYDPYRADALADPLTSPRTTGGTDGYATGGYAAERYSSDRYVADSYSSDSSGADRRSSGGYGRAATEAASEPRWQPSAPDPLSAPAPAPAVGLDTDVDEVDPDLIALAQNIGFAAALVWVRPRRSQRFEAVLHVDGQIELTDGSMYANPDAAAMAASGSSTADGWSSWRFGDGGPSLMDEFRHRFS